MLQDYSFVLLFFIIGLLFSAGIIILSKLVQPRVSDPERNISYESGENPIGNTSVRFNNRFHLTALIFLIFEIEIIVLFLMAVVLKRIGFPVFIEMMIFIGVIFIGLLYIWSRGDLEWDSSLSTVSGVGDEDRKHSE